MGVSSCMVEWFCVLMYGIMVGVSSCVVEWWGCPCTSIYV